MLTSCGPDGIALHFVTRKRSRFGRTAESAPFIRAIT